MPAYTLKMVEGTLAIVGSDETVLPISLLDKHRIVSNHNQIGRRYWDDKWQSWSYEVLTVKPGIIVTGFISE